MSKLAYTCLAINNANRNRHKEVKLFQICGDVKEFLLKMMKFGYLSKVVFIQSGNKEKAVVTLNGRLNKCGAILPNFNYDVKRIPAASEKLKPASQFGHVIFKTNRGIIDHNEAVKTKTGGKILGFFY